MFAVIPKVGVESGLHLFEALIRAHGGHGVALDKDVAIRQELQGLQGGTVWSQQSLPPLDKFLLRDMEPMHSFRLHVLPSWSE